MKNFNIQEEESELLKFQRSLSKQFMTVIEDEKSGDIEVFESEEDKLGISLDYKDVQVFLELESLKNISSQNNYEKSLRSKSWLLGFNQERGDVYTIYELENAIKLILTGESNFDIIDERDKQIIYLKDVDYTKQALFLKINNDSLQYTAGFTPLFFRIETMDGFIWEMSEEIEFESFIQKENMSNFEWMVLNTLKKKCEDKKEFIKGEFLLGNPSRLFVQLIKGVYLDEMGVRPIFTLDVENFTKYLSTVSAF